MGVALDLGQCPVSQFLWSAMGVLCPQDCYKGLKQVGTEFALSRKIHVTEVVSKHPSPFLTDREMEGASFLGRDESGKSQE